MSNEDHNHGLEDTKTREEIEQVNTSTSQSQANSSHNEVVLDIRVEKLLPELDQLQKDKYPTDKKVLKIKKTPEVMKRDKELAECFTPKWKFGPIHYPRSSEHDKKVKLLAALFISENGSATDNIFKHFKANMDGIRACFGEDIISHITDEKLTSTLFLDGCAILGFMHCYVNWRLKEVDISTVTEAAEIERDLLLVENQIPFRVLEVLIDSGRDNEAKENLKESVVTFIYLVCKGTLPGYYTYDLYENLEKYCFSPKVDKNRKAVHLLDVFREALLFNPPSFDLSRCLLTVIPKIRILCPPCCLAISSFLECFKTEPQRNIISFFRRVKEFFFSVQELKAAGIKFKPTHSLKTVSFRSLFFLRPQLMLPTLIGDDLTKYKLLNLVAYEMCLSNDHPNKEPWVTSYVNLLDSLVDNEQDIKDLRAADVLRNTLSADEDAAKLINHVGTGCIPPADDAYMDVKEKVGKYYRTTCAVWMAQFCSTHFSSPWTIMAFFAATAVLTLTATQTWYAVHPKK